MPRRTDAGFTLAELMLVMVLVGVLLGIGVAGVDRVDPGARGLQASVEAFVKSTRDRARSTGQPVVMAFVPASDEAPAQLVRYVFRQRLEANFEPAFSEREGVQIVAPASLGKPGRIGAGLDLSQGGGATLIGRGGRFRSPAGLQVEFDFRADELDGGKMLAWKDLATVELQRDGSLRWKVVYQADNTTTELELASEAGLVRKGRWHHLRAIALDGQMQLYLDGELLGEREATGALPATNAAPYLGDPDGRFTGAIDEFVVWGRVRESGPTLNDEQDMFVGALELVFDRFGRLDPSVHEEPVDMRISTRGTEVGAFRVGVFTEEVQP